MVANNSESLDFDDDLSEDNSPDLVLGQNQRITRIAHHANRAAQVGCTVLITGETGTGKEVWARMLQRLGPRRNEPFVPVNCAALSPSLAESQLFGHVEGAFTGAAGASLGVFRTAESGIVFLDEVGDMPLELQPKLLRVLQEREVTPVGSSQPIRFDAQIITATNRNLEHEVEKGRFREDLYYRLNLVELHMPSLRERPEDIPEFIAYFSEKFSREHQLPLWQPEPEVLKQFCEYRWPGNIRQLSFVIEQAYILQREPVLPNAPPVNTEEATTLPFTDLDRLRRIAVEQALCTSRGHRGRAAHLLGVHPNTLTRLMAKSC